MYACVFLCVCVCFNLLFHVPCTEFTENVSDNQSIRANREMNVNAMAMRRKREREREEDKRRERGEANECVRASERGRNSVLCEGQMLICCFCCLMCWRIESHRAAESDLWMKATHYTNHESRSGRGKWGKRRHSKPIWSIQTRFYTPMYHIYVHMSIYAMPCDLEDRHTHTHMSIRT